MKQGIAEGKRIRKYFYGNFYPVSEVDANPRAWCLMQYHLPDERDGIVMAFRRDKSLYGSYNCQLREIDPSAIYRVTRCPTYTPDQPITMNGTDLEKLNIEINERPGSMLVEYKQLKSVAN